MADSNDELKAQNKLWLAGFAALHLVIFWGLSTKGSVDFSGLRSIADTVLSGKGFIAAGSVFLVTILGGVFPDHFKAVLVFWRWRHPLPGCRAFTVIAKADPRIDFGELERHLGTLPTDPAQQNRLWYKVYKTHANNPAVTQAHRVYLLTRDITCLSALFLLVLPVSLYLAGATLTLVRNYGLALLVIYMIVAVSSRNYANRFVTNVLALLGT